MATPLVVARTIEPLVRAGFDVLRMDSNRRHAFAVIERACPCEP
jgi:hypothetical protein